MILESLKQLARTAVEIVRTRLELLSLDVEEAKLRLLSILLLGAVAFLCLSLGVVMGAFWLVAAFWETHRMLVLGLLTGGFLGGGVLALAALAWRARKGPRLFAATIAELEKDGEALGGRR
ncbi:MAG: phage holin family protein [Anaeromyxobacteraceae bacterium]